MLRDPSKQVLLNIARNAIREAVTDQRISPLDLSALPGEVQSDGASFVTLTIQRNLRGCIGSLEARQPLAKDIQEHAVDAALNDYRFPPLTEREFDSVRIEISVLSPPEPLVYTSPEELTRLLRPNVDGIILARGPRRATFLPQVWESIPDPTAFLNMLCEKMGADSDLWRREKIEVYTYQVERFAEPE
jgi:AmmeMemoRadiSam system protein A